MSITIAPSSSSLHRCTILVSLLFSFALSSCASRGPVLSSGDTPERTGTISGVVRAAGSNTPIAARRVTAVETSTGATLETSSASHGGYTMKVPIGKYRLEVELGPGESLVEGPKELEIKNSDLDTARNFIIRM
jgi:hypothetical protein